MNNQYVEVLVKRNVEKEQKKRTIIAIVGMAVAILVGLFTAIPIFYFLSFLIAFGAYFLAIKYYVEFEYYYMDGELSIAKVYNRARRKDILNLNEGSIKLIAPISSIEVQEFDGLKIIDCTANDSTNLPYVIVCEHKGNLKKVYIQMNEELFKELKRNMPYKVRQH